MELPEYKIPSLKRAAFSMLGRAKAYIIKAATIILVCNAVVQIMQSFNWQLQLVEEGMERYFHSGDHRDSVCGTADSVGLRRMADGSGGDYRLYRQRKCGWHAGGSLRTVRVSLIQRNWR